MKTTGLSGATAFVQENRHGDQRAGRMTLQQLRHDIRNHLNAIKLSCALLQRQKKESLSEDTIREIDSSADSINELITQYMGDADAPGLLEPEHPQAHA